jgi:predicted dehydrogenase
LGTRPQWYFEPGKQGGTIIDIAVHAIDALPWVTGLEIDRVDAARNWSTRKPGVEDFRDAAQVMLTLENGAGVLGDVSYLSPNSFKYDHPFYWEFTFWGSRGVARTYYGAEHVALFQDGATEPSFPLAAPMRRGHYLDCLLREIQGISLPEDLTTAQVLTGGYVSLLAQRAADETLAYLTVR